MTFFTIQEFKDKYNQDVSNYQIEIACEMIYQCFRSHGADGFYSRGILRDLR